MYKRHCRLSDFLSQLGNDTTKQQTIKIITDDTLNKVIWPPDSVSFTLNQ